MLDKNDVKNVIIEFELPYALELKDTEDFSKPSYEVLIDNQWAYIQVKHIYHDEVFARGSKIYNDRYGLLSHSIVWVGFYQDFLDSGKIRKDMILIEGDKVFLSALKYLNKFISSISYCR